MRKLLLCLIPLLFCGCTHDMSRREIDEIDLVLVLGIDYIDGEYSLSALYNTGGGADPEKGAGGGEEQVAKGQGRTAFEALQDLKRKNKKELTLAQTGSFLIGDGAARQGLKESIDFISRDETIKMEALIYVIKDKDAVDFIEAGIENKQNIHEDMEAMEQKQKELLTRSDNTVVNILNDLKQTLSSVIIPYLIAEESGYLIEGYAVFDKFRLRDYLDQDTSDGVNFIINIMRSYPIYLDDAGLLVSYTKTKLKADLNNKKLTVTIRVSFETMVKEIVATSENLFSPSELERLTEEQNEYIRGILEKAVNYSATNALDILKLARLVENQNFSDWKTVENEWNQVIPEIQYEYIIESRISKSFISSENTSTSTSGE